MALLKKLNGIDDKDLPQDQGCRLQGHNAHEPDAAGAGSPHPSRREGSHEEGAPGFYACDRKGYGRDEPSRGDGERDCPGKHELTKLGVAGCSLCCFP